MKVLGKRTPTGLPSWVSKETEDMRQLRDAAKNRHVISKSIETRRQLKQLNLSLNQSYKSDELKHLENQLAELTEASNKKEINKVWSIINELSGKNCHLSSKVKKRDGTDPVNQQEILKEWKDYFSTLRNNRSTTPAADPPPAETDLPINTDPPTLNKTPKPQNPKTPKPH